MVNLQMITRRHFRNYKTMAILDVQSVLLLVLNINSSIGSLLAFAVILLLSNIPASLLVISAFIMGFIEKAISNSFVKEAKDILKSMPYLKVIGVTGSYGKTSAKFILKRILIVCYKVIFVRCNKSNNNWRNPPGGLSSG